MGVRNIDQKNNVFDFIDLDTNEKIRYEKLFADGKEIQAFSALNEKKPMVLLFFDKSELEFNSDGSLKQLAFRTSRSNRETMKSVIRWKTAC